MSDDIDASAVDPLEVMEWLDSAQVAIESPLSAGAPEGSEFLDMDDAARAMDAAEDTDAGEDVDTAGDDMDAQPLQGPRPVGESFAIHDPKLKAFFLLEATAI